MEQAFMMAATNNLNYFYQQVINLQMKDSRNQSLLHYAVRTSSNDVIEYLLQNEVDVNVSDYMGETPLFDCVRKSKIGIAKLLIRRFANLNHPNLKGELPIHLAAQKGDFEMIKLLIENGANIDKLTKNGESVIHYSVKSNHLDFFKQALLLCNRLSHETDFQGNTLLHIASELGFHQIVAFLVEQKHNIHLRNHRNETPLFSAVRSGSTETIRLLLDHGAYIDVKNRFGESIKDIVNRNGNHEVKELFETHQHSSIYQKNIKKYPLRYAVLKEDIDLLSLYLYQGIEDVKDDYQLNACEYATKQNLKDFIKQLKEKS